jgi:hypothetical protein
LFGVIVTATRGRYHSYDFRLASLLVLGIAIVFAAVLCLTAVSRLARGHQPAWERASTGTLLLVLVTVPVIPLPVQGELASFLTLFGVVNLVTLVVAWRLARAGPAQPSQQSNRGV